MVFLSIIPVFGGCASDFWMADFVKCISPISQEKQLIKNCSRQDISKFYVHLALRISWYILCLWGLSQDQ